MQSLFIHYQKQLVGTLNYYTKANKYDFTYSDYWRENGFEISPSLKFDQDIDDTSIRSFIENLLPEGEGLEELSILLQISKSNKFAMLRKIGLDTTGALTFSDSIEYNINTSFRKIPEEELIKRVENRDYESINIWDGKPRFSVAGVEEKLSVIIREDQYGFGEGDLCSTHILKFNKKRENVILNEYISLRLAKSLGFNVTNAEYKKLGGENVLFIERFDREMIDLDTINKIHIIDSVQALGLPVSFKYERNLGREQPNIREGVSFEKLFSLEKEASIPLAFKQQIIDFCIITLITGNSDAHGKNISFFVDKDGLSVAPFYDIVNIIMYPKFDQELAMGIDEGFEFNELCVYDFQELFKNNHISINYFFNRYKGIVNKLGKLLKDFSFVKKEIFLEEREFIEEYKANIIQRVNNISKILNETRFILPFEGQNDSEFFEDEMKEIKKVLGKSFVLEDGSNNVSKYLRKLQLKLIQII